ncbi:hypothetical protein SLA2020_379720 [Shorea laevis]
MAFFEAMRGPSLSGPGSGLGVEPSAKEASSQLQLQPLGATDPSCGVADRDAGPGAGGKGVQSFPETLCSLLGAWEDRVEKMIGKMDRVIAAVWVGLVQFGLGCGSVLRKLGPGTLRKAGTLRRARFFGKLKPKLKPKISFLGKRPHQLSAQASETPASSSLVTPEIQISPESHTPPSVSAQISPETHIPAPSSSSVMEPPSVVQRSPEIQIPASSPSSVGERPTVDQITPECQSPASSSPSAMVRASVDGVLK